MSTGAPMATITVTRRSDHQFRVEVQEGGGQTIHDVTLGSDDLRKYGAGAEPEALIKASFEFLLEREPKESILRSFALPVIERYFPDYPRAIRQRLP